MYGLLIVVLFMGVVMSAHLLLPGQWKAKGRAMLLRPSNLFSRFSAQIQLGFYLSRTRASKPGPPNTSNINYLPAASAFSSPSLSFSFPLYACLCLGVSWPVGLNVCMFMSLSLCLCMSACVSLSFSVCVCVFVRHFHASLRVRLSLSVMPLLFMSQYVCLQCRSLCLSFCLSVHLSAVILSIHLFVWLSL